MKSITKAVLIIAALLPLAAPAVHAQSVGDILGKAKDKIKEATGGSAKGDAKQSPDGAAGQETNGNSKELTEDELAEVQSQQKEARAMLVDRRPVGKNDDRNGDAYFYRVLVNNAKLPIKFTWDEAAVRGLVGEGLSLTRLINGECFDLSLASAGNRGSYMLSALHRIKEIHFSEIKPVLNARGLRIQFVHSFNKTTGVLTIGHSHFVPNTEASHEFVLTSDWVFKNMTSAPAASVARTQPTKNNGGSASAQTSIHTWECAFCHQTVQSVHTPDDAGCTVGSVRVGRPNGTTHLWHIQ